MALTSERVLRAVLPLVYGRRRLTFGLLALATAVLAVQAGRISFDASFDKQIPLAHPYMKVFERYRAQFGGANLIAVALINRDGDIYNAAFLDKLRRATDDVFFVPGVDRARVSSLFTPGVRYVDIVEGGFETGDVVPRDYQPSPQAFARIRGNVAKAHVAGRLVANDQRGAMIVAELLEHDPQSGARLDYRRVSADLESIRARYEDAHTSVHVIGFAKVVGDVAQASRQVAAFFAIALLALWLLLWLFCGSLTLSLLPLSAALVAVVWEFGLMRSVGLGLDPFAILVPFLIMSLGVSHGVQYINAWGHEVAVHGHDSLQASIATFRRLAIPGTTAILTDVIGFATVALIHIRIVQELALNAALGMASIIIANKVMLPIILSWVRMRDVEAFRRRQANRRERGDAVWRWLRRFTQPGPAKALLAACAVLLAASIALYPRLIVGDTRTGVPELRPDGRYNRDSRAIAAHFSVGVDLLKVIVEAKPYGCVDYRTMSAIDDFSWRLSNVEGVVSVSALPLIARVVWQSEHEGDPRWRVLPIKPAALASATGSVPSVMGLSNLDCSAMPVFVYLRDHSAHTVSAVTAAAERFAAQEGSGPFHFALASGNVGVTAAVNDEIRARALEVVLWVYGVLLVTIWLCFRSAAALVCIVGPLAFCSMLTYGFMALTGIGEKPATLPVVAFGVGIGVDDGIYLWGVLAYALRGQRSLGEAFLEALRHTGKATVFTSLALILGIGTWLFSGLQFQADMGLLLLFMFTANLFGAVFMLPALAWLCNGVLPLKPGKGLVIQ